MLKLLASITPPPHRIRYSLFLFVLLLVAAAALAASLNPAQAQAANGVYDTDSDGLIEISNLQQLYFIRHDVDGNGRADDSSNDTAYARGFPVGQGQQVCNRNCDGYELTRSLDFDSPSSYLGGEINTAWTMDAGWTPIRGFKATFDGNGHTISNLYMDVTRQHQSNSAGLFGYIVHRSNSNPTVIRNIGLLDVDVTGVNNVGGLVGEKSGADVSHSYVTGSVSGTGDRIGGLVGRNYSWGIHYSYSTATVTGNADVGGLVGENFYGGVYHGYATGDVSGTYSIGGLVGYNEEIIQHSYATGTVSGTDGSIGGLVGWSGSSVITDSYAIGRLSGTPIISAGWSGMEAWVAQISATATGTPTSLASESVAGALRRQAGPRPSCRIPPATPAFTRSGPPTVGTSARPASTRP